MPALRREFDTDSRGDLYRIVPLADIHIGNAACDEKLFAATCQRIAEDDRCWWIGLGDYCEFINRGDKRFSATALADWLKVGHLADLAAAQRDRFLDYTLPISSKCLGLVGGNHEAAIKSYYERDIFYEIVQAIKQAAGHPPEYRLGLDFCGWLMLSFKRDENRSRRSIKLYLHHGFVGGKLAGAKALNIQRWLWTHAADLVLFGHSHNTGVQVEAVEELSRQGKVIYSHRMGAYAGTFMRGAEYAERKGYFPLALSQIEVILRPGAVEQRDRVKVITSL